MMGGPARLLHISAVVAGCLMGLASREAFCSEIERLAIEIAQEAVQDHHAHHCPDEILVDQVRVSYEGDITRMTVRLRWYMERPRTDQVWYSSDVHIELVNRAKLRRIFDISYQDDCGSWSSNIDHTPELVSRWNERFSQRDRMDVPRDIGQPLHGNDMADMVWQAMPAHPANMAPTQLPPAGPPLTEPPTEPDHFSPPEPTEDLSVPEPSPEAAMWKRRNTPDDEEPPFVDLFDQVGHQEAKETPKWRPYPVPKPMPVTEPRGDELAQVAQVADQNSTSLAVASPAEDARAEGNPPGADSRSSIKACQPSGWRSMESESGLHQTPSPSSADQAHQKQVEEFFPESVAVAAFQEVEQPAPEPPAPPVAADQPPPQPPRRPNPLRFRLANSRMARAPEMFGDQFIAPTVNFDGPAVAFPNEGVQYSGTGSPSFGSAGKISENNHTLPRHRIYYNYNFFQDALDATTRAFGGEVPLGTRRDQVSISRHTVGVERTFLDDQASIEFRLPFYVNNDFSRSFLGESVAYDGGVIGNLSLIGKRLLYTSDTLAAGAGVSLDIPVGDDSSFLINTGKLGIKNEAFYLSPFFSTLWTPNDNWFVQGFLQVQFGTNGNSVNYSEPVDDGFLISVPFGVLTPHTAATIDVAVGRWLFRAPERRFITGAAVVAELNSYIGLQKADKVINSALDSFVVVEGPGRRAPTNLTLGLHTLLGKRSTMRVAWVAPLHFGQFENELIVHWNLFF